MAPPHASVRRTRQGGEFPLHPPLPPTLGLRRDVPEAAFGEGVGSRVDPGQVEDGLLDVRGKVQEAHDLGDPGPGDARESRDLGVVPDLAGFEVFPEAVREGQESRDPRDAARFHRRWYRDLPHAEALAAVLARAEVDAGLGKSRRAAWQPAASEASPARLPRRSLRGPPRLDLPGQHLDARGPERDRQGPRGPVVADAFDQKVKHPGLLPREQGLPHGVDERQCVSEGGLVDGLAVHRDGAFAGLGEAPYGLAEAVLEVGEACGRVPAPAGHQAPHLGVQGPEVPLGRLPLDLDALRRLRVLYRERRPGPATRSYSGSRSPCGSRRTNRGTSPRGLGGEL